MQRGRARGAGATQPLGGLAWIGLPEGRTRDCEPEWSASIWHPLLFWICEFLVLGLERTYNRSGFL